jgi:aryl-alcohol dehydrogenase-like predicted oxidoreductase
MMEYRTLGQNLSVSALSLGCMGMSEFYGAIDEQEALATIHRALDLGVTMLDTADVYGPHTNEVLVGRALAGRREGTIVATKFGIVRTGDPAYRGVSGRPEYVRASCEASLRRLGIDAIDLYYQHRVDPATPIEETVGTMSDLVREGKVRFLGLSEAGVETLRRASRVHPIAALQSEYSLWTRDPEDGVLAACRELGIGLVAYSPLGRGFLAGRIRREDDLEPGDFRRNTPRFQGDHLQKNLALAEGVAAIAREKGCTPAQLALAWVLAQGQDIVPIVGTKRRTYLEENLGALHVHLEASDLARLDLTAPRGAGSGDRYNAAGMTFIDR